MGANLYDYQIAAIDKMKKGCILNGGVGSGKSRTAIGYYYMVNGGSKDALGHGPDKLLKDPKDLYIITTAMKRDKQEWLGDLAPFLISPNPGSTPYKNKVVIDSWNNIQKYKKVYGAFFIFDEDHVTGSGAWVKAFYDIARKNHWIILSATPGDTWIDYIPVFIANGFYPNKTAFINRHVVYKRFSKYPQVERFFDEGPLIRYRNDILVNMDFIKPTTRHHEDVYVDYDKSVYKELIRTRWNPFTNEPIKNASELCYTMRKIVNSDVSRQVALLQLFEDHPKLIVFYNFDYERDILMNLYYGSGTKIAEWNGHTHNPVPTCKSWIYLVQYTAGCEGWNCITTDTIVFFSQNYSYKVLEQSCGRIDRCNTKFLHLYYYHFKSRSGIDLAISRSLSKKKKFNEGAYYANL